MSFSILERLFLIHLKTETLLLTRQLAKLLNYSCGC